MLSRGEYESWAGIPGFDFAYEHKGLLEIFQTPPGAAHARHIAKQAQSLGLETSLMDADALQQ
ncbi:MAG TPA: FAD-dependent oxidoreductase, partial [Agriterribacter sp.]|nr:FAD-dependent oxidoreductase [Agriterribacter sp.]